MRDLLDDLSAACPVAIVSGRDLDSLRELARLDIDYIAEHGMVLAPTGGAIELHPDARPLRPEIDAVETYLRENLADVDGVLVERKQLAVAVHYRLVGDVDVARVDYIVAAALADHPHLRVVHGKKVHEFRPDIVWDKGRAVLHWAEERNIDPSGIIFIGDDRTDEDVFRAIRGQGVSVVVWIDPRATEAAYCLASPAEVGDYLRQVLAIVRKAATG
jgi:trehalose-phosphatase